MRKVLIGFLLTIFCISAHAEPMTKKKIAWIESQEGVKDIGCSKYDDGTYSITKKEPFKINESAFKVKKLFDGSSFTCYLNDKDRLPVLSVVEVGKVDGVDIRIYHSDGSGLLGDQDMDKYDDGWHTGCKQDAMTDDVICYVRQNDLSIFRDKDGYIVRVGSSHYPDSVANLRINKDTPFSSGEEGIFSSESSKNIVNTLTSKDSVMTRYIEWPNKRNIDKPVRMENYDTAKKVLDLIFDNHN
ncbi:hypothetical protein NRH57_002300 [Providencia rettgeri]|nr:hypothetical protein [Providencia rettgeri]ELR5255212.1 hypothetical protein [Providencia rettgeri]